MFAFVDIDYLECAPFTSSIAGCI